MGLGPKLRMGHGNEVWACGWGNDSEVGVGPWE